MTGEDMNSKKIIFKRRRRGLTGLETAIILIAFVITAAAFAFAVLNVGFQTTQQAQTVIRAGAEEASSAAELDGAVIAYGDPSNSTFPVQAIQFVIRESTGRHPIDLSVGRLVISYYSKNKYVDNVYDNSTDGAVIQQIVGDGDTLLEYGEKFLVTVYLNGTKINSTLNTNDMFRIEVKPSSGTVLIVERTIPPSIDQVMFLG